MSFIFKYHPDNVIYRNNEYYGTFKEFSEKHPSFPIDEGAYFSYYDNGFDYISDSGNHQISTVEENQEIVDAINNL